MTKKKTNTSPAQPASAGGPSISIGGDVGGPLIIGSGNAVINEVGDHGMVVMGAMSQVFNQDQQTVLARALTPPEIAALSESFQALNRKIEQEAPDDAKAEASRQAAQLQKAVTSPKPDVSAMAGAKLWFAEHLPLILGTVTGLLTNPLVGKLVETAGEFTLDQFRERLGLPPN